MVPAAALINAAQYFDTATGGAISKFAVKNAGKLIGHGLAGIGSGIDWVGSKFGKNWNVKEKIGNVGTKTSNIANSVAGEKNEVAKQIGDAAKVMRGENVPFSIFGENKPDIKIQLLADPNQQTALIPYVRNVGGSNYHKAGSSSLGRNKRRHRRF